MPNTRKLAPGEQALVRVRIKTASRSGKFANGGMVTWRGPGGEPHPVRFVVSGEVVPPVVCTPGKLTFDPTEARTGVVKEIVVSSRYAVDWDNLSVQVSPSGMFEVTRIGPAERGWRYGVRCTLSGDIESAPAVCLVSGQLAKDSPVAAGSSFSLEVPLQVVARNAAHPQRCPAER